MTAINMIREINGVYTGSNIQINANYQASDRRFNFTSNNQFFTIGAVEDIPNQVFTSEAAGLAYIDAIAWAYILDVLNNQSPALGGKPYTAGNIVSVFEPVQKKLTKASAIADAPTDLVTDCPTDADTNANLLSLLTIGAALNANASKQNSGFTKCNANFSKVNTGFGKVNAWLAAARANDLVAA